MQERMNRIRINRIRLDSFVKLCVLIGMSSGIAIGIIAFLLSFISESIYFNFGGTRYAGFAGGIGNLIGMPIILSIAGALYSLLAYLPLKLFLKLQKGQIIEGDIEVLENKEA